MTSILRTLIFSGFILIFQGCSKAQYAFNQAHSSISQPKTTLAELNILEEKQLHSNIKLRSYHTQKTTDKSHQAQISRFSKIKLNVNPIISTRNNPKIKIPNKKVFSKPKTEILKKVKASKQKPAEDEWILGLFGIGLFITLIILILTSLNIWAVIGIMLVAILISIISLYKLFWNGFFGKMGG